MNETYKLNGNQPMKEY